MSQLIKNVRIINGCGEPGQEDLRDIFVQDGIITDIRSHIEADRVEVIDACGNYVVPGLIDMHCNICDPGYENKEDIFSVSKSAAKGGFTTITCLPNTNPVIDNKTVVNYIITKSRKQAIVNIIPYGSMTRGNLGKEMAEIGEMIDAGIVAVSDGDLSIADSNTVRNILLYTNMFDIPVITFCDDLALSDGGVINKGIMSTKIGLLGIPREAEETIVARNIILARHNNSKLHITQVSTRGSVELIRNAKKMGVDVTCDTSPHYFTLTEEATESYNTYAKVRPPLRTADDVESIIEGLTDGTIDVICSGHSPVNKEEKMLEFDRAAYGISSLETSFFISYTELVKKNILTFDQLISKMSVRPANILNLNTKGRIEENYDADFVIIDVNQCRNITMHDFASKAKYSPFDGWNVFGKIMYTVVNGKIVYLTT